MCTNTCAELFSTSTTGRCSIGSAPASASIMSSRRHSRRDRSYQPRTSVVPASRRHRPRVPTHRPPPRRVMRVSLDEPSRLILQPLHHPGRRDRTLNSVDSVVRSAVRTRPPNAYLPSKPTPTSIPGRRPTRLASVRRTCLLPAITDPHECSINRVALANRAWGRSRGQCAS